MNAEFKKLKIDRKLAKEVIKQTKAFISKNENHVRFFGDGLIGTPVVKFLPEDRAIWFEDIADIDEFDFKEKLHALPEIFPERIVSSDTFNHLLTYLAHRFLTEKKGDKLYIEAAKHCFIILHCKFLTSLMSDYFEHEANRDIALATYTQLNKRFSLKRAGSWYKLFIDRAEDIIDPKSIHYKTLIDYKPDDKILYVITDAQTRVREVVKAINAVFYKVLENDARIASSSRLKLMGEEIQLVDRTDKLNEMLRNTQAVIRERTNFIREEVMHPVTGAMHTMPEKLLIDALEFLSDNYGQRRMEWLEELVTETILHAISFINSNNIPMNDFRTIMTKLRGIYMSPSTDVNLMKIKELAQKLVDESVKSKNETSKNAVRTGILLYIAIRALVSDKLN